VVNSIDQLGSLPKNGFKKLCDDAQVFALQVDRKWCQSNVVLLSIQRREK